jgi:hypothetical protein
MADEWKSPNDYRTINKYYMQESVNAGEIFESQYQQWAKSFDFSIDIALAENIRNFILEGNNLKIWDKHEAENIVYIKQ